MHQFASLYQRLDETTKTSRKVAAMADYFREAHPRDAVWAVYFLSGRRFSRFILARNLRAWGAEATGLPNWLFEESYDMVGDMAETIALLLPVNEEASTGSLADWIETRLKPLKKLDEIEQAEAVKAAWAELPPQPRFVFNKLMTGGFRVGVSQGLVIRALAKYSELSANVIAHRMMGTWQPTEEFFRKLIAPDDGSTDRSRPYPFCLAHPHDGDPSEIGERADYQIEWKWDGIRAQFIRREGHSYLWSRGEELILERFPELIEDGLRIPDGVVLDGEVAGWLNDRVLPFTELQRRINRKTIGKKLLTEVPVCFIAFDLIEWEGRDVREEPLSQRRAWLEQLCDECRFERISPSETLTESSWEELAERRAGSRELNVEGLMLKPLDSPYATGRVTGVWWKWKIEPYTVDCVLLYAQRGHGRRANLYTDYTFAVWDGPDLVPFAKAYIGLTDEEFIEVDKFVRANTKERFGPVRSVTAELVFELAFENIQPSKRHKSGIAVRFPRMVRWRQDKKPEDADTLAAIKAMLPNLAAWNE